jgi:hypothetical protein
MLPGITFGVSNVAGRGEVHEILDEAPSILSKSRAGQPFLAWRLLPGPLLTGAASGSR